MADKKARYSQPASQVDLERRQKSDNQSELRINRDAEVPLSTNGYVGVDDVYQTAANNTERPRKVEKGPEAKLFKGALADDAKYPDLDADEEKEEPKPSNPTPPPTGNK